MLLATGTAWSQLNPIPKESGFSGFVNVGTMYLDVKTNMLAGNEVTDVGHDVITSLSTGPNNKDDVIPVFDFNLRYTFARTRTQLFFGNSLEDFLRFDFATQAGVRQGISDKSSVSAAFILSSLPAQVWADPYVVNTPRQKTDRTSSGARLNWENVLDSNFTAEYTYRKIDIDNEVSGLTQLGLPFAQASLLRREGDQKEAELSYVWQAAPRHTFVPAYHFTKFNLDGAAMSNSSNAVQLTYAYRGDTVSIVANAVYESSDYDQANPIYLLTREDDTYTVGTQIFWHRPFGAPKGWSLLGTFAYVDSQSNIDFYDERVFAAGLSAFYRF